MVDEANGIAGFLDGKNMITSGSVVGNRFIAHLWQGDIPTLIDDLRAFNSSAKQSAAWGFTHDSTPVTNEMTTIATVVAKYRAGLETGTLNCNSSGSLKLTLTTYKEPDTNGQAAM